MPKEASAFSITALASMGFMKLGQPVPESNLSVELKRACPDTIST
jgi:hypothetical protein